MTSPLPDRTLRADAADAPPPGFQVGRSAAWRKWLRYATGCIVATAVILGLLEIGARLLLSGYPRTFYAHPAGWARVAPYVMYVGDTNLDLDYDELDHYRGKSYKAHLKTNNYGFRVPLDFGVRMNVPKADNERVVILTGGSAAYGVGARSNETTIAGRLEHTLNVRQDRFRYRVYPFAQGGWVAYQEFLAVEMWGRYLHPDWIISMSGSNDGKLPYHHRQTVPGAPNNFNSYKLALETIYYKQYYPTLWRSETAEFLLRNSQLARVVVKQHPRLPVAVPLRTDFEQLDDSAAWYFHSLRALLNVCPKCRYIVATQPISNFEYRYLLADEADFERVRTNDQKSWYLYYISRLIRETPRVVADFPQVVAYRSMAHTDLVFPGDEAADSRVRRQELFNDDVHMNDAGQAAVAAFFADIILRSQAGETVQKFVQPAEAR